MTKIKICGVAHEQDALWAANLGADFIGFNFYSGSPRKVSPKLAKGVAAKLPPFVHKVGVFVDAELQDIVKTLQSSGLGYAQLHGKESPDFCALIREKGVKVIKVWSLAGPLDPVAMIPYEEHVDYWLFDHRVGDQVGGTGLPFDWSWLGDRSRIKKPFFIAGGLRSENVQQAIATCHPWAVDVSSGVEQSPGRKDFEKMKQFVQKVKGL